MRAKKESKRDMVVKSPYRTMVALLLAWLHCFPAMAGSFPALQALQQKGVTVSAAVIDLQDRRVLAQEAADQALIPASATKLFTAGLALESWGPSHRFETRLLGTTSLQDGNLDDLILMGGEIPH